MTNLSLNNTQQYWLNQLESPMPVIALWLRMRPIKTIARKSLHVLKSRLIY
jgi:hypothetical protein